MTQKTTKCFKTSSKLPQNGKDKEYSIKNTKTSQNAILSNLGQSKRTLRDIFYQILTDKGIEIKDV